jgi:hypothetical protein
MRRRIAARLARHELMLRVRNSCVSPRGSAGKQSLAPLRVAYNKALEELQLLKHRLFVAKAERRDATQEQLAFDSLQDTVNALADQLQEAEDDQDDDECSGNSGGSRKRRRRTGRRDLSESELPIKRVELRDEALKGRAEVIGFETSWKLGYERGGARRIQVDRAIYKTAEAGPTAQEPATFETAPLPKEIVRRGLVAPSMIAHVLTQKFMMGVPFYRIRCVTPRVSEPRGVTQRIHCREAPCLPFSHAR